MTTIRRREAASSGIPLGSAAMRLATLADLSPWAAAHYAERLALTAAGQSFSFRALDALAAKVANALQQCGFAPLGNKYPAELERIADMNPAVAMVAVGTIPDTINDEVPNAYNVL